MRTFIDVHVPRLRELFGLNWCRAAAYTIIRWILKQLNRLD